MNETQTAFAVFFAVFLGAVANVQPRWKAFNWPVVFMMTKGRRLCIARRLILSIALLSLAPAVFFGVGMWALRGPGTPPENWTAQTAMGVVLRGVFPAFGAFSFYRLWIGIVEAKPHSFYVKNQSELPESLRARTPGRIVEPSVEDIDATHEAWFWNVLVAVAYLVVPTVVLLWL